MIAKYFDTSFAMLNVVNAPRVISNCLPISTTSISLVGLLSKSTMLAASRGLCAGIHRDGHIGLGQRGRIVGAIAGHRHQSSAGLIFAN